MSIKSERERAKHLDDLRRLGIDNNTDPFSVMSGLVSANTDTLQPLQSELLSQQFTSYLDIVAALHAKWDPHKGQKEIIKAIFQRNIKFIFVRCGRKFGKTETGIYLLWRWAQTFPGSACYYIAYEKDQAYEIVWKADGGRIQNFGPSEWVRDINKGEMRVSFKNGSFIKVDGSDNWKQYEGQTPAIVIADEVRLFRREWWETMEPNLSVKNAPIVFMGTPPADSDSLYNELEDEAKERQAEGGGLAVHYPSWVNDKIPHLVTWLKDRKRKMLAKGLQAEWQRQYEAIQTKELSNFIFPSFFERTHFLPKEKLIKKVIDLGYPVSPYLIVDPAASSTFGGLFILHDRHRNRVYIYDEIYAKGTACTNLKTLWPQIYKTLLQFANDFRVGLQQIRALYDPAEAWFASEINALNTVVFAPCQKLDANKQNGLAQIINLVESGNLWVADEASNFTKEMSSYKRDAKGNLPKKNDHLIDCFRYFAIDSAFTVLDNSVDLSLTKEDDYLESRIEKRDSPYIQNTWDRLIKKKYFLERYHAEQVEQALDEDFHSNAEFNEIDDDFLESFSV